MRNIHPAAWAGLVLNAVLTWALFMMVSSLGNLPASELGGLNPELFVILESLRPVTLLLLGLQALAIGFISLRFRAGVTLAVIAGFCWGLPVSLLYIVGCFLSRSRVQYADFPSFVVHDKPREVFPSAAASRLPIVAFGGLALCLLCFSVRQPDLGLVFFGLSLTGVYCAARAKKFHALCLHDGHFAVTPGLFADPLTIPYEDVRSAALHDDESIHFSIESRPGRTLTLVWSLRGVEKKSRRAALESLGNTLASRRIPLY
jgi:hypothetical protein